jgi:hypothetical protein
MSRFVVAATTALCLLAAPAFANPEEVYYEETEDAGPLTPTKNDVSLDLAYGLFFASPVVGHGLKLQLSYSRFFGETNVFSFGPRLGFILGTGPSAALYLGLQPLFWLGPTDGVRFALGPTVDLLIAGSSPLVMPGAHLGLRLPIARHFALEIPFDVAVIPPYTLGFGTFRRTSPTILSFSTGMKFAIPF